MYRPYWRRMTFSGPPKPVKTDEYSEHNTDEQEAQNYSSSVNSLGKVVTAVLILGLSAYAVQFLNWNLIRAWYLWGRANPTEVLPIFILLNALAVIILCPGALIQMFAGAVFGTWMGSLASFVGTFAGQLAAFILGRYMFRDALAVWMVRRFPSWTTIETALFQQDGAKLVFLLRLSPLLPDSVMNYALALTSVGFGLFASATACSLVPYTILYCYVGSASKDIMQTIRGGTAGGDVRVKIAASVASVLLFLALLVYLAVLLKRALAKAAANRKAQEAFEFDAVATLVPLEKPTDSAQDSFDPHWDGSKVSVTIGGQHDGVMGIQQPLIAHTPTRSSSRHTPGRPG